MNNGIPDWRQVLQEHPTCAGDRRAVLKIILKTKDENFLLQDWIDHHARIVGFENLLVLDNLSTDPEVLGIYKRYAAAMPIGSFDGFVDNPHTRSLFAPLYARLAETTAFYSLLDTDERLVWVEDGVFFDDSRIVEKLSHLPAASALPGTWLYNQPGSKTRFGFGAKGGLADGLRWGKPVISASANRPNTVVHNLQAASMFDHPVTNFFVLHLSRLSAIQRVNANANKLRSYSVISNEDGLDAIAKIDLASIKTPALVRLVEETRKLSKLGEYPKTNDAATPDSVVFRDGRIEFHDADQKRLLQEFIAQSAEFLAGCYQMA